ncbi:hypothetical protein FOMPIDRAFT_1038635 [Fomitopsis schrenkii]|uniref:Inactive metallocarboxypeptidase ECM14 n=1 Tax=Fomitopsis schrenkii TaxID=2126942 RepID=S8DR12_FOMSC|nr:hypothetical protein FOMPIDRAFT_1038635 [Fomitopsis schrenkii]
MPFWLLFFLLPLSYALSVPSKGQTILQLTSSSANSDENQAGVLTTISTQFGDKIDVAEIVGDALAANADVWRITPSEVDLYFRSFEAYDLSPFHDVVVAQNVTRIPATSRSTAARRPSGPSSWNLSSLANTTFHSEYHPLHEIEDFVRAMANMFPELVQVAYIGHSAEGREMTALRISKPNPKAKAKPGFVLTGAQHAREWVATSTVLYLTHALVSSTSEDHAMSSLLDDYDFHIIPVPNPDGYVYTWEHDRFWYKNRQVIGPYEECVGIDMNRNWGHKWKARANFPTAASKKPKTPTDPCTPWYPGHRAFESPEVNNIANYITTLPVLKAYIDLRSYGQMISTPFAYSCKKTPKDAEDQIEAAHGAARAIRLAHGTSFTTGSLCSMVYKAPGNVVDWMYAKAGIKYSYAVHLRDTGTYGFALPPEWIRPVGEETANMVQFLAEFIMLTK